MSITFDAATAAAVIRNQGKLIDILSDDAKQLKSNTAFCANLQNRVTELLGENTALRAKLADAETTIKLLKADKPPVPYALEAKQEKKEAAVKSCKNCAYGEEHSNEEPCLSCVGDYSNWKSFDYRIPREGCKCGACQAAIVRGEV